ncbi:transglycosylase domain-containing protein [Nocardioides sp. MAHUQ-72]|uniref:transglycosylase domain-containing protein n=1 Tax=unclassified Nocardioides TaxID=2615069 RepID=UPI00361AA0F7
MKSSPKPPSSNKARLKRVGKWLLVAALVGALVVAGGFFYLYRTIDIPNPNKDFQTQTSFVYYADGKTELGQYATQNRESIPLKEIPQKMQDAVVAAENQSFWTDKGIDPKGILRAAFSNARGNSTQGASTITQQYVKILYLTQERSYQRKLKEAVLSLKIQKQLSKSQILEGYLNTIYFGRGAYGVQAASRAYFDKDAKDLSLREAAVLASVLNNPTLFDPANGKDARANLKERYAYVLNGMADQGNISADQAEKAEKRLPVFPEIEAQSQYGGQKGHMLSMVRDELHELGFTDEQIDGGGLRVTTTFTKKAMDAAEQGVMEARPDGFSDKQLHIAVASVEPGTGALRGFYGGQDYVQSQINWAETGGAPGSSFKPFALAAGLKEGFSLKDTFEGNSPYYYNGEGTGDRVRNEGTGPDGLGTDYGSAVNMITATEESINTAYADLTMAMGSDGPEKILETANALGIPKWNKSRSGYNHLDTSPGLEPVTGIALGSATVAPINMANAYATIANGGQRADVHVIDKVVSKSGEPLWSYKQATKDAIPEDIAADTSYAMQQVVQHGTGTAALALGRPAAGKTGTATNADDDVSSAWFVGYTPQLSTAVMYVRGKGNEQLDGWLPSYFGADYPADTWTAVMKRDMEGLPVEDFPPPAYVDGEAPEEGHDPYTPPPSPTRQPSPTKQPSQSPTKQPSSSSSPSQSPSTSEPSPSDTCGVLGCGPSGSSSSSPSQSPSSPGNPSPTKPGNGNGVASEQRRFVSR